MAITPPPVEEKARRRGLNGHWQRGVVLVSREELEHASELRQRERAHVVNEVRECGVGQRAQRLGGRPRLANKHLHSHGGKIKDALFFCVF